MPRVDQQNRIRPQTNRPDLTGNTTTQGTQSNQQVDQTQGLLSREMLQSQGQNFSALQYGGVGSPLTSQSGPSNFPAPTNYNTSNAQLGYEGDIENPDDVSTQIGREEFQALMQRETLLSLADEFPQINEVLRSGKATPLLIVFLIMKAKARKKLETAVDRVANLNGVDTGSGNGSSGEIDQALAMADLSQATREDSRMTDQGANWFKALHDTLNAIIRNIQR